MCTEEKVKCPIKCPNCDEEWDYLDEDWPSISIDNHMVKITDFFCKECSKILWGYTKVEWK